MIDSTYPRHTSHELAAIAGDPEMPSTARRLAKINRELRIGYLLTARTCDLTFDEIAERNALPEWAAKIPTLPMEMIP